MDLLRTKQTYSQRDLAVNKLRKELDKVGLELDNERWLIATNDDGRFAPVLVGTVYLTYGLHFEVTVVS